MLRRSVARLGYPVAVLALLLGICVVAGFLAVVALPDVIRTASVSSPSAGAGTPAGSGAVAAQTPTPSSAMALSPIGIAMPSGADCSACHTTTTGQIGVKNIPYMAHPLKGFANCTACHNPTGLVKTAPGHDSLHANDCLVCHQENPQLATMSSAPMRPEHMGAQGKACTSCHGMDQHAPLPSDMAGRGDNCWICHNGPEFQYLFNSASPGASTAPATTPAPSASASPQPATGYQLTPPTTAAP
jgi:hypothetical protein